MSNTKEPNYWRSFEELHGSAKFQKAVDNEFSDEATMGPDLASMSTVTRRKFLGLMAASTALAGTACSNYRDEGEIRPYNNLSEQSIPGVAAYYASTFRYSGASYPVLVKSREGRPIKINGNTAHPATKGRLNTQVQAFIGSLYDPSRLTEPMAKGQKVSWTEAFTQLQAGFDSAQANGKEIAIVSKSILSASQQKVFGALAAKYPQVKNYSYELFSKASAESAFSEVYGSAQLPSIAFNKAQVVVAFESDFLGNEGAGQAKALFSEGRSAKDTGKQNRLYSFEGDLSLTGMNADIRSSLRPEAQLDLVLALVNALAKKGLTGSLPADAIAAVSSFDLASVSKANGLSVEASSLLVQDLVDFKGQAIAVAGDKLPKAVQIAVLALNAILGAESLYEYNYQGKAVAALSDFATLAELASKLGSNKIGALVVLDANPVFELGSLGLDKIIGKADFSAAFTLNANETSNAVQLALPVNHALEAWGETSDLPGIVNLQQPLIAPLYNSQQAEDVLLAIATGTALSDTLYREFLKKFWKTEVYAKSGSLLDATTFWNASLHDGFAKVPFATPALSAFQSSALSQASKASAKAGDFTLILKSSNSLGDGTLSNVGWLQELPNSVSKITWDNYVAAAPATLKKLGVSLYPNAGDYNYDFVTVTVAGREVTLPAFAQPGLAEGVVVVELGYGHTSGGVVTEGVGFDANALLAADGYSSLIYSNAKVTRAAGTHQLASTQEHNALDLDNMPVTKVGAIAGVIFAGSSDIKPLKEMIKDAHLKRGVIKEATVAEFAKNNDVIADKSHMPTFLMDRPHTYTDVKWEMVIDQNKCTGCSECVISCNVENNIPVVGKDQVLKGREMHWMRIDRYYAGTPENPIVSTQPMLCQQCDNAPCENVCPVVATSHSPDGINEMTYNRCVGTRYCANNCPYKVRRFNFYNFRDHFADGQQTKPVMALMTNPEVTVRSRGVMEKCNFCVQRLRTASAEAKRAHKEFDGAGVQVACQEVCPTDAIYFGNVNDPKSKVAQYKKNDLAYRVLDETGVRPNVHYIAKLRNTEGKIHS